MSSSRPEALVGCGFPDISGFVVREHAVWTQPSLERTWKLISMHVQRQLRAESYHLYDQLGFLVRYNPLRNGLHSLRAFLNAATHLITYVVKAALT